MKAGSTRKVLLGALAVLVMVSVATAQDIPVKNWQVPMDDLSKQTHLVDIPTVFSPVEACRLYDSRVSSGGPGPIANGGLRNFDFVSGGSTACGTLPGTVRALSVFFTVVGPLGPGFIYSFPTGSPPGSPTSIINYNSGELRNNASIIPVNPATGSFTIGVGGFGTDIIIDLNGVFYNSLDPGFVLNINGDVSGSWVLGGTNANSTNATVGVLGNVNSATGSTYGVLGDNDSNSTASAGVWGRTGSNSLPSTGGTWGVLGTSYDTTNTFNIGVIGVAQGGTTQLGVYGTRYAGGVSQTAGALGYIGTSGVHSFDNITAVGMKSFLEPHPTDPGLEVAYVSLEGNEAGTYFRGKGKFQSGVARIPVPEDFRIVSEEAGLSIQITPIGDMATVAVQRINLNEIVVKGSRNVEFFYMVNGVRRGRADFRPIRKNLYFKPADSSDKMLDFKGAVREKLIQNGTLNPDGTPNLETAEKLGWKAEWEKQAAEAKAIYEARRKKEAGNKPSASK